MDPGWPGGSKRPWSLHDVARAASDAIRYVGAASTAYERLIDVIEARANTDYAPFHVPGHKVQIADMSRPVHCSP